MTLLDKKTTARNEKAIHALIQEGQNNFCADCGQKGTRWASWNLGVFLCIQCGGIHRKLGTHISKVKSVALDSWTDEQLQNMIDKGNENVNRLYNPTNQQAPPYSHDMEQFIRDKYERKIYMGESDRLRLIAEEQARRKELSSSSSSRYMPNMITDYDFGRYDTSLRILFDMGFNNTDSNLTALRTARGDVQQAIEYLVATGNTGNNTPIGSYNKKSTSAASFSTGLGTGLQLSLLEKLKGMGFLDETLNRRALELYNWKIEEAINYIVSKSEAVVSTSKSPTLPKKVSLSGLSERSLDTAKGPVKLSIPMAPHSKLPNSSGEKLQIVDNNSILALFEDQKIDFKPPSKIASKSMTQLEAKKSTSTMSETNLLDLNNNHLIEVKDDSGFSSFRSFEDRKMMNNVSNLSDSGRSSKISISISSSSSPPSHTAVVAASSDPFADLDNLVFTLPKVSTEKKGSPSLIIKNPDTISSKKVSPNEPSTTQTTTNSPSKSTIKFSQEQNFLDSFL